MCYLHNKGELWLLINRQGDSLDLFKWAQYDHKGPYKWKEKTEEEVRVIQCKKGSTYHSALKMEEAMSQGSEWPQEAEKDKEIDPPLKPLEKNVTLLTP